MVLLGHGRHHVIWYIKVPQGTLNIETLPTSLAQYAGGQSLYHANSVPMHIRMSATAEYLTAAEKRAHETSTILKTTLPTAATRSSASAIASTFCAVVPAPPSSCTRQAQQNQHQSGFHAE